MIKDLKEHHKDGTKEIRDWCTVKIPSITEKGDTQLKTITVTLPHKDHECLFGARNPLICIKCPKYNQCLPSQKTEAQEEVGLGCCGNIRCSTDVTACLLCPQCGDKAAYKAKLEASGTSVEVDSKTQKIYQVMKEFNQGLISADESISQIEAIRKGEEPIKVHKTVSVDPFLEKIESIIMDLNKGLIQKQNAISQVQDQATALIEELKSVS